MEVLYEAQAIGKGAISMHTSKSVNIIDPQLFNTLFATTSTLLIPSLSTLDIISQGSGLK
jgi:hypothetical protein